MGNTVKLTENLIARLLPDHFRLLTEDQRAKHTQYYYANRRQDCCYVMKVGRIIPIIQNVPWAVSWCFRAKWYLPMGNYSKEALQGHVIHRHRS